MRITSKNLIAVLACLLLVTVGSGVCMAQSAPGDIRYERNASDGSEAFPPSIFPHWKHRIHYRCDACHDELFEMKLGGTPVTMALIDEGEVCGACHNGERAFRASLENCNRCHVALEED